MIYSEKQLVEISKRKEGFKSIPANYWIICVRSNAADRDPNKFECSLNLMKGEKLIKTTSCTTVPGLPALLGGFKKYNSKGAGVVCANIWMYDTFKFGLHQGKMRALRMVKPVWSTRDGNLNSTAEEYGKRSWGNIYANIHGTTFNRWSKLVRTLIGHWSYACIACNNNVEYNEIIDLTEKQAFVSAIIVDEFSI